MTNSVAFALSLPAFTRCFQSRAYITIQCISLEPKLPFRHTMSPWGWNGCWGQPPKDYRVHVQLPSAVLFWTCMPCSTPNLCTHFAQAASGKRQAASSTHETANSMQHAAYIREAGSKKQGAACSMSSTIAARGSTARSMQPAALSAQHAARGKRHAASSTHAASGVHPAARLGLNGIFATLS